MKKFYIKIILNEVASDETQISEFIHWIEFFTPLQVEYDILETSLPLRFKDFVPGFKKGRGLDGIKSQVRPLVQKSAYNAVFFFYKPPQDEIAKISAWTYPNPLTSGDAFVEIPIDPAYSQTEEWPFIASTHEICHVFHRLCWFSGKSTKDTMDLYDKNNLPDAPDGNRARNIREVSPYWNVIAMKPATVKILESILALLAILIKALSGPEKRATVSQWALAIKKYEGWYPFSRSFRNNNPGNLKYRQQEGTTGADPQGFAIFSTDEFGWNALLRQLTIAINGQSQVYNPDMTLIDFFSKYAEDNPETEIVEPIAYANFVARELGLSPQTKIKEIGS